MPTAKNLSRRRVPPEILIEIQPTNPKRRGSKAAKRFHRYMKATTKAAFLRLGGTPRDFSYDRDKGFLRLV